MFEIEEPEMFFDAGVDIEITEDDDEEEERDGVYDDDDEEEEEYARAFGVKRRRVYREHDEKEREEYAQSGGQDISEQAKAEEERSGDVEIILDVYDAEEPEPLYENQENLLMSYGEVPRTEILTMEYDAPELINGQKTYQRIVFEADMDGESVYDLTVRKLGGSGMDIDAEYDSAFDSMLVTSINGKSEGDGGNFNEFYLNGEIGENAVDMEKVKKGDIIEWRYAEETDGTCGGVPDFSQIKSQLQYTVSASAYGPAAGIQPLFQSPLAPYGI